MSIQPWFARMVRRGIEQAKKDVLAYGGPDNGVGPLFVWGAQPYYEGRVYSDAYLRTYQTLIACRLSGLLGRGI